MTALERLLTRMATDTAFARRIHRHPDELAGTWGLDADEVALVLGATLDAGRGGPRRLEERLSRSGLVFGADLAVVMDADTGDGGSDGGSDGDGGDDGASDATDSSNDGSDAGSDDRADSGGDDESGGEERGDRETDSSAADEPEAEHTEDRAEDPGDAAEQAPARFTETSDDDLTQDRIQQSVTDDIGTEQIARTTAESTSDAAAAVSANIGGGSSDPGDAGIIIVGGRDLDLEPPSAPDPTPRFDPGSAARTDVAALNPQPLPPKVDVDLVLPLHPVLPVHGSALDLPQPADAGEVAEPLVLPPHPILPIGPDSVLAAVAEGVAPTADAADAFAGIGEAGGAVAGAYVSGELPNEAGGSSGASASGPSFETSSGDDFVAFRGVLFEAEAHGREELGPITVAGGTKIVVGEVTGRAEFDLDHMTGRAEAEAVTVRVTADGKIETPVGDVQGSAAAEGPSANASVGVGDGHVEATVGASAGEAGVRLDTDILDNNVGVGAEVGLKAELGADFGYSTKVDLPFISLEVPTPMVGAWLDGADWTVNAIEDLVDDPGATLEGAWNDTTGAVKDGFDTVLRAGEDAVDAIGDAWDDLWGNDDDGPVQLTPDEARALSPVFPTMDFDNDGILNGEELQRGTDPAGVDSDGDNIPDREEIDRGTNPTAADSDSDGMPDQAEYLHGSDPNTWDTDGDGYSDQMEIWAGTKPNNPDSDGDGLDDRREGMDLRTSGKDPDSDDDGYLDGYEVQSGSDPNNAASQPAVPDVLDYAVWTGPSDPGPVVN
ncbi:hypothetical protein ACQEVB_04505 [Pseudonocardia sp. CA-107938]|uniref:hypothetical protein n=1 Tax=Pseudonocardia sp. CA-107938 TaxID=3240021 RepID=UPI003D946D46